MAGEPLPLHAGMGLSAELLIRDVLANGLHRMVGDREEFDELVERFDTLPGGSQGTWAREQAIAFRRLLDSTGDDYLKLVIGYPTQAGHLPCVSIVKESASEDTGGAVAGDLLAIRFRQVGTYTYTPQVPGAEDVTDVPLLEELQLRGTAYTTSLQIGSWTTNQELSLVLDSAVQHVLFKDKGRLNAAGVTDVTFSEAGFPPDSPTRLALEVGYVPAQRVTLDWIRGQVTRKLASNRVRYLPPEFS